MYRYKLKLFRGIIYGCFTNPNTLSSSKLSCFPAILLPLLRKLTFESLVTETANMYFFGRLERGFQLMHLDHRKMKKFSRDLHTLFTKKTLYEVDDIMWPVRRLYF